MRHNAIKPDEAMTAAVRRVAAVAAAHAADVDREARFPAEAVQALREEGLLGALVPHHLGGGGATMTEATGHCQILARACAAWLSPPSAPGSPLERGTAAAAPSEAGFAPKRLARACAA